MSDLRRRDSRRGLSAAMMRVKPHSREEVEFVTAFANALAHATAVVAAEPDLPLSTGSIAHRLRTAYARFRPDRHPAIQQRARARLSETSDRRHRYFGVYADRGAAAWTDAEPGLDGELKSLLNRAVRARLEVQQQDIAESLSVGVATQLFHGPFPTPKTTLEIGYFSGDVQAGWTSTTIVAPITVDLRWETNAADAEQGVWQLFHAGPSQQEILLGSGKAGNAPGSVFSINLGKYLPANPPDVPAVYLVRVTPGTKAKVVQGPSQGQTGKVPSKAVGPPSNDVVITYAAVIAPDVQIQIFEIYQTATFMLESIYMVEDQSGPGSEEFHVAGFVQESFPASSAQTGTQKKFGPFFAELDPDGPVSKSLSHASSFFLDKPDAPEWPRAYTAVVSVLEEDDGGSVNEWQSSVWTIADDALSGEVSQLVREFLEEKFADYVGNNLGALIQSGGQVAQAIGSLIGGTTGAIVGMVVAAATLIITDLISGMQDDYFGTEVFVLVLPTNITDYIHGLPGQSMAGGYQLDSEALEFKGYTSWPEATAFDGIVDVYFHWEFTSKGQS